MQTRRTFTAFFSYAHHDADTDPQLVEAFTVVLEKRVNAKIVNARFTIWRDEEGLRTGDKWAHKLEEVVSSSDILIVLLTPRWIDSDFCRKEYLVFEEAEAARNVGEYIVPILARSIEKVEKYFTKDQTDVWARLSQRQYAKANAVEFLRLGEPGRTALIDDIAEDIEGMIEFLCKVLVSAPKVLK
jgi:hypothetical protein